MHMPPFPATKKVATKYAVECVRVEVTYAMPDDPSRHTWATIVRVRHDDPIGEARRVARESLYAHTPDAEILVTSIGAIP